MPPTRIHLSKSLDQLDELATQNWSDISALKEIDNELEARGSKGAAKLQLKIYKRCDELRAVR
jgi:hypothetical protein